MNRPGDDPAVRFDAGLLERAFQHVLYDSEQNFFEALRAGASGYVLKSAADRDLVEACRAAVRGEPFLYRPR